MADPVKPGLRHLWRDCRGAVAAETALVSLLLVTLIAQALDFGWYVYCSLQVRMAAQAAVAEAAVLCNTAAKLPATDTTKCTGLTAAMTTAAQSVSLGSQISITQTNEGYYCADPSANNALTAKGAIGSKPTDCTPYSAAAPSDFIRVRTSYTFAPLFPGLTVVSAYTGAITSDAWMRLG